MASGTIQKLFPSLGTANTEYPTNELFFGKPVYAKLISYGNLTANTEAVKEFFTVSGNPGKIVRFTAWAKLTDSIVVNAPYDDGTRTLRANALWYYNNYWRARIGIKCNQAATDAYGCLWYTKD